MYQEMRKKGLRADPVSLSFVIRCYIRVSSLNGGEQVHARILGDGHQSDSLLLTNLMDFRRTRDVLVIFDGMLSGELGCEPDDVTCLLLLQACASLGALEFGEKVHGHIVERGYDNATNLCNSLIAMYSQFGNLDKAFGVFKGMHNKNVVTWSAIISEHVVEHLIELKAQEAGDYILLFNLYSSVDNWKKVTELRKFMKEKGIQTTPASSSIELKGKVHEFVVDDVSHPQKDEIYEMLDEIINPFDLARQISL
ncbi:hypothetical protein D5086_006531 [Populus alba]|uniref:Uncharacterized protein n=1 Tax=Populus alba TaxID=43335 RepID=A0ACC4CKT7_POPAL